MIMPPCTPSQRRSISARGTIAVLVAGLGLASPVLPAGQARGAGDDDARARHLLGRATWGVRSADLEAARASGLDAWLDRQLQPARIDDRALDARLDAYPAARMPIAELFQRFSPRPAQAQARQQRQEARDAPGAQAAPPAMTPEERRARQARGPARLVNDLVGAKIARAVYSERQLEDVMTDFWFNHFNVFVGKGQVRFLVADYERTAIRPHVFGRFEDMLLATAQHPAMLVYLDNWQSVYAAPAALPDARQVQQRLRGLSAAQREDLVRSGRLTRDQLERLERGDVSALPVAQRQANRGLNENYARELLELHTLGVDGGYTQDDVVAVARAFTGWSFLPPGRGRPQAAARPAAAVRRGQLVLAPRGPQPIVGSGDAPFVFRPDQHDPGEKVVLGTRLRGGRGVEDGRDVIRMLARHPSTARHLATKLVERFVSDDPPLDLVDHLAGVFLRTNGDLRAVTRALFTADAFYREDLRDIKVKTPFELVVSALRATQADVQPSQRTAAALRTLGHLPYSEPAPTGFPATSDDWVNAGAMLHRITLGLDLAAGRLDGVRPDLAALADPATARQPVAVEALLATLLPGQDTARLADRIREDLEAQADLPPRQQTVRALGLALGSPEFQRR